MQRMGALMKPNLIDLWENPETQTNTESSATTETTNHGRTRATNLNGMICLLNQTLTVNVMAILLCHGYA